MTEPDALRRRLLAAFRWRDGHADQAGWWREPGLLSDVAQGLAALHPPSAVSVVAAVEARGFLLAPLVAAGLGAGVVLVRKPGALLPGPRLEERTDTDYRGRRLVLAVAARDLRPTDRVLFVDEWAETGAQALAVQRLVARSGATWVGAAVVVDGTTPAVRSRLGLQGLLAQHDLGEPAPSAPPAAPVGQVTVRQVSGAEVGADLRRALVQCWVAVTNAGGAVGFPFPPVDAHEVEPALDTLLAGLAPDRRRLLVGFDADGPAGWVCLDRGASPVVAHTGTVSRLQTHPRARGRGVGTALMRALAVAARDELGLAHLRLDLRGGMGLERFYARLGWREVGRVPGALRLGPGDDRDEVTMWLDLDRGGPRLPAGPEQSRE